ncbi:MAG: tetraacyldisaccharide 4'-kinase [Gammaproteobacteria bacterium]|nr:tetraacyldisaccharide 4'-kinase [Gammaproteobacteria bacterium]NNJ49057.1 tetraacyldisaccharide 4'-kinase [Gammaproteobacteria bacterium]
MKSLEHYWYQANYFIWLLIPISWLFCAVSVVRRKLYQLNLIKSYSSQLPVVVIGNIVAGGSGKTPLLIALCELIKDMGYRPGVVSRGYGGDYSGLRQVTDDDPAELVGDEPLMVQQRTKVPVVVSVDRAAAVTYLQSNDACDIVLSDDGLQHYRMRRDLEIAVVDARRRFGNGYCLPAGPLREPLSRLQTVDLVAYNTVNSEAEEACSYTLQITQLYHLGTGESSSLSSLSRKAVHAVAGIGDPGRFFTALRKNELAVIEHAFSDHHRYTQDDFSGWHDECIIMTEKDAVKCRALSLPDAWVIRVDAELAETLESQLNSKILPLLKQRKTR